LRALDEGWGEWALGTLSHHRGDRPEAVRHLLQAMRLGRDKAASLLAVVFAEAGLREEALRAGGEGNVYVLFALGDRARALDAARAAVASDPGDREAEALLFHSLYAADKAADAAALAARLWEHSEVAAGFDPGLL